MKSPTTVGGWLWKFVIDVYNQPRAVARERKERRFMNGYKSPTTVGGWFGTHQLTNFNLSLMNIMFKLVT